MKLVVIGDTHRCEREVKFPKGDVLIHTGDFDIYNPDNLEEINDWFNSLKFKHIIFTGGNHDFLLQNVPQSRQLFNNATCLINEGIEIEGKKFWASPYTPEFHNWAFMYPRCSEEAKRQWEQIPEGLDVLITHGPPYDILDKNFNYEKCGCEVLQREVFKKKPKHHVFGHIHPANNNFSRHINIEGIDFHNVSVLDEDYKLAYKPTIIEI